ncbi:MAG: 2-nitropropane dioxygenase [Alphaproteobacteria bacterium]|nr:2-nitropropane dioxygenase [Alphaproteobacteria bacterium]
MAWTAPEPLTAAAPRGAERLDRLWRRGRAFLGTRYAIMGGAMTWVSERTLVAAISEGGGFGVLACGAMKPDRLAEEIRATAARTAKPFGVNLIVMHPELDGLVEACLSEKVSHVVLAGGLPSSAIVKKLKDGGAKVMTFLPAAVVAKKLMRSGIDAFITEGAEAGGHIGAVSTSVLAQEILPEVRDVPVFVAGGIGRGEAIASYLEMGAAGCQLGTRFVCAAESIAHPNFKRAFIRASARDAMPSIQLDPRFPVIPVRAIVNKATERFLETQREVLERFDRGEIAKDKAQLEIEHFWAGALRRAVIDGDVDTGSLMAGQSVGMVTREQPIAEILEELVGQATLALAGRDQIGEA